MDAETVQKVIPTQKTRLNWLKALSVIATAAWLATMAGYITTEANMVTFVMWAEFEKWLFISYGATEVGSKYSHAVMNK